jgi:hypothetical protein
MAIFGTLGQLSARVLLVCDLLEPLHGSTVQLFLNRNVRQSGGWGSAVPVFLARGEPDDVAGTEFFHRPAPALGQTGAFGHDQVLPEWVRVPRGASAGLKRDESTGYAGGGGGMQQRFDAYGPGEVFGGAGV